MDFSQSSHEQSGSEPKELWCILVSHLNLLEMVCQTSQNQNETDWKHQGKATGMLYQPLEEDEVGFVARSGVTWFVFRTELGYREKPGQLPSEPGELLAACNASVFVVSLSPQ